VGGSDDAGIT